MNLFRLEDEKKEQINGKGKENKEGLKGVDQKFYSDIMAKFKDFEKLIQQKDKENQDLQNEFGTQQQSFNLKNFRRT